MPHLVIAYSQDIEQDYSIESLMNHTYQAAVRSELFSPERIKVRAKPYEYSLVGGENKPFAHTTVYLLSGRDKDQKISLAQLVREAQQKLLTSVETVSVDVRDLDRDIYQR